MNVTMLPLLLPVVVTHCCRCAVSTQLLVYGEDDLEAPVPRVCPHLPPTLSPGDTVGGGGAPKHILQALHLLRTRVWPR